MAKNDEKIKLLLSKIEKQKEELGVKPKAIWNTNGIFKYDDKDFFNINTVNDPIVLVKALAFLISHERDFNVACEILEIKYEEFEFDGYHIEAWSEDFQNKIRMIKWDLKKKNLDSTQKKLNSLISEELRTEVELEEIEKLLG